MTLTSEQFRVRMVDYLYEMLEGEELRTFEAHLQESADARRELAALQRTLLTAREGLAQTVDQAPPARVRGAVLAAAQVHAVKRKPDTRAEPIGFWNWLRAGWLVPALGVAAAVMLVVFGKNIESPRVVSSPAAQNTSAAVPSGAPPSAARPVSAPARLQEKTEKASRPSDVSRAPQAPTVAAPGHAAEPSFAVPPPAWVAKRSRAARVEREAPEPATPVAAGARRGEPEREAMASEDKASAQPSAARADREGVADSLGSVAAPAPAKPSAPAASSGAANAVFESDDANSRPADDTSESALVRRAQAHVAAKRWREAEADYRELLRRYPDDARVASWKKQLALANRALHDAR